MSLDQIVDDFNSTFFDLINNISDVCPNNIVADNKKMIQKIMGKPENINKIIDTFVAKVLIYKPQIDEGKEEFFLKKSYENDIKGEPDANKISSQIFEFKTIWKGLSPDNKRFVIEYMKLLCILAQNYFLITDSNQ